MSRYFFFSSRRRHTRCLSDWSSDVCSSDLARGRRATSIAWGRWAEGGMAGGGTRDWNAMGVGEIAARDGVDAMLALAESEIGRASCRERVESSVGAGAVERNIAAQWRHEAG